MRLDRSEERVLKVEDQGHRDGISQLNRSIARIDQLFPCAGRLARLNRTTALKNIRNQLIERDEGLVPRGLVQPRRKGSMKKPSGPPDLPASRLQCEAAQTIRSGGFWRHTR